jgi:hypothetical protein
MLPSSQLKIAHQAGVIFATLAVSASYIAYSPPAKAQCRAPNGVIIRCPTARRPELLPQRINPLNGSNGISAPPNYPSGYNPWSVGNSAGANVSPAPYYTPTIPSLATPAPYYTQTIPNLATPAQSPIPALIIPGYATYCIVQVGYCPLNAQQPPGSTCACYDESNREYLGYAQ